MDDLHSQLNLQDAAQILSQVPVAANLDHLPLEGGEDPAFGSVRWRTMFCGDKTATSGIVMGVAEFGPHGHLAPHRHGPSEIYFGLEGDGIVTIDGVPHAMAPGRALFIPADAEHGTVAGETGLRMLYVFPKDRFSEVSYRFSAAS